MGGKASVVSGWKNKIQGVLANVTPEAVLAEQHRKMAEPGTADIVQRPPPGQRRAAGQVSWISRQPLQDAAARRRATVADFRNCVRQRIAGNAQSFRFPVTKPRNPRSVQFASRPAGHELAYRHHASNPFRSDEFGRARHWATTTAPAPRQSMVQADFVTRSPRARFAPLVAIAVSLSSVAFSSSSVSCSSAAISGRPSCGRPGDQRAVARDLVMLDRLRRRDQRRIEHRLVGDLAGDLVGFLDDPVDRRAGNGLGLLAQQLEDLLQPRDLAFGLAQVRLEAGLGAAGRSPCRSSSAAPW